MAEAKKYQFIKSDNGQVLVLKGDFTNKQLEEVVGYKPSALKVKDKEGNTTFQFVPAKDMTERNEVATGKNVISFKVRSNENKVKLIVPMNGPLKESRYQAAHVVELFEQLEKIVIKTHKEIEKQIEKVQEDE